MNNGRIINKNNGRVVDINNTSFEKLPMFLGDVANNKFKYNALKGIQTPSPLSLLFFSKDNIDIIQQIIRHSVWKFSNETHIIDRQSDTELEIIMRSIYLQHSQSLQCKLNEQIRKLNKLVTDWAAPKIFVQIQQYIGYLHDVEHLPMPIDRPTNISNKGSKVLKSVTTTF